MNKIKTHVKENKDIYIGIGIGAGVVLAGITCVKMRRTYSAAMQRSLGSTAMQSPGTSPLIFSAGRDMTNVGNVTHVNFGGHAHKLVRSNSTGEIWESIGEAAADLCVDRSMLSKHLNGHLPNIHGETYSIIGVGTRTA